MTQNDKERRRENIITEGNTRRENIIPVVAIFLCIFLYIFLCIFLYIMIHHVKNYRIKYFQVDYGHLYRCDLKYLESTSHPQNFSSSSSGISPENLSSSDAQNYVISSFFSGIDLVQTSATLSCLVTSSLLTSSMSSPRLFIVLTN